MKGKDLTEEYNLLKKAYDEAIAQKKLIFELDGQTYLVAYAKYRLEYYQTLINPKAKEVKSIDMDFKKESEQ
jgi:hypothetical protein